MAAAAVFALTITACGGSAKVNSVAPPTGWTAHSFAGASISAPNDWAVYDQEKSPGCPNEAAGNTLQLGVSKTMACPAIASATAANFVHINVTRQASEPVLTTIVGMSTTNEPVNSMAARRLHYSYAAGTVSQDVYIAKLHLEVDVTSPVGNTLGEQVLQTLS